MSNGYEPHVGDIVNIEFVVTGVRDFSKITARCGAHIQIHDLPASDEIVHFVSRPTKPFEVGDLVFWEFAPKLVSRIIAISGVHAWVRGKSMPLTFLISQLRHFDEDGKP